ncbi:Helix-turn-helix [Ruminococcaceae bacterium KH2T8]|nr:Helix-turn-helix [Ruminococcaceae bacterium KH2T8]
MRTNLDINRLKAAREAKGITMAEAARQLNLSKIGYCRYEYGERTPSIQTIEAIARCFNTSVSYLIGETDDISPDYMIIKRFDDPELFDLVQSVYSEKKTADHILQYFRKIKTKS